MDSWYIIDRGGRQLGPLSHYDAAKAIQSGIAAGTLGPESEIWHEKFGAAWKTIATSEFAHMLGAAPATPPPPPRRDAAPGPHGYQGQHHAHAGQHQGGHGWNDPSFVVRAPFFPEKSVVVVVYVLYLLGIVSFFITPLIGLVIAYVQRGSSTPTGRTHFTFQIYTFWLSLLYSVVNFVASMLFLGLFAGLSAISPAAGLSGIGGWIVVMLVVGLGLFVWHLVRVIKGLVLANGNQPVAQPDSWWLG